MDMTQEIRITLEGMGYIADADSVADVIENNETYKTMNETDGTQATIEQMAESFPRLFDQVNDPDNDVDLWEMPSYKDDDPSKQKKKKYNPGMRKTNIHAKTMTRNRRDEGGQKAEQRHKKRII